MGHVFRGRASGAGSGHVGADPPPADGSPRWIAFLVWATYGGTKGPANTWKMGTIYTRKEIDASLKSGKNLATRDALGHGTTTAGIACGGGSHSPGRKYRGI